MTIEGLKSEVERTTYKIKSPNKWEEANKEGIQHNFKGESKVNVL